METREKEVESCIVKKIKEGKDGGRRRDREKVVKGKCSKTYRSENSSQGAKGTSLCPKNEIKIHILDRERKKERERGREENEPWKENI